MDCTTVFCCCLVRIVLLSFLGVVTGELGSGIALPFLDAFSLRLWAVPGTASICKNRGLVWGAAIVDIDAPTIRVQLNECTLRLLADVSDGLNKLGEVGGEHMSLLQKLGKSAVFSFWLSFCINHAVKGKNWTQLGHCNE